jgi:hypothetical protein
MEVRPTARPSSTAQVVYQKAVESVVTLNVERADGSLSLGTAFLCIREGLAVTALHVVRGARKVTARFSDGEEFESTGLVDKDEMRDLAIIRLRIYGRPTIPISSTTPGVGERALVIGSSLGMDFTISDGIISQVRVLDGLKVYQFTCAASPGNSGGPLFNAQGEVIGVVSWQLKGGQNLNFAVPALNVLALDSTLPTSPWSSQGGAPRILEAAKSRKPTESEVNGLLGRSLAIDLDTRACFVYTMNALAPRRVFTEAFMGLLPMPLGVYFPVNPRFLLEIQASNRALCGELGGYSREASGAAIVDSLVARHHAIDVALSGLLMALQLGRSEQGYRAWCDAGDTMGFAGRVPWESNLVKLRPDIVLQSARVDTRLFRDLVAAGDSRLPVDDRDFASALPVAALLHAGVGRRAEDWRLGIQTLVGDESTVVGVMEFSIASEASILPLDKVLAAYDCNQKRWVDVSSWSQAKAILNSCRNRGWLGHGLRVRVQRSDGTRELMLGVDVGRLRKQGWLGDGGWIGL